jgi:hypothetical protein
VAQRTAGLLVPAQLAALGLLVTGIAGDGAARSPPARHQMALRLGDGFLGESTAHRRERLYG